MTEIPGVTRLLEAIHFAARKHKDQRRKDAETSPYVNHPIEVAMVLATIGKVTDLTTLIAALLHDTIEDTETTGAELEDAFGREVRLVVEEVTDDHSLPKLQRKQRQIDTAPALSDRAKQVKIADKICNMRDVARHPPVEWPLRRRKEYIGWTGRVVDGCRGVNPALEAFYDETFRRCVDSLEGES